MPRIVGNKYDSIFRGTCMTCGGVIEEDIDKLYNEIINTGEFASANITCPQCGSLMAVYPPTVERGKIPENVKIGVDKPGPSG